MVLQLDSGKVLNISVNVAPGSLFTKARTELRLLPPEVCLSSHWFNSQVVSDACGIQALRLGCIVQFFG